MKAFIRRLGSDETGVTAIEYGLIAALVAVIIVGAFATLGPELTRLFGEIETAIQDANPGDANPG